MTNEAINRLNIYSDAFNQIRDVLNERDRRLFLAEAAVQAGFGAITILSRRTGVAVSTIRRGIDELSSQKSPDDGYIRCRGAGRKPVEEIYPDITGTVQEILDDETYGSPEGGKWTSCSLRSISKALADKGIWGESGKTLVVYYSASGNTEAVAGYIAEATNADTLELVPVEPYSDEDLDWTTDGSRVNKEHDDESLRDIELVETTATDWDSYDTVFIGYEGVIIGLN